MTGVLCFCPLESPVSDFWYGGYNYPRKGRSVPQSLIGAMKTGQIGGSKGAQRIEMVVFSFSCWERLRVGFLFSSQVLRWSVSILPTEFFIFLMRFSGFLTGFRGENINSNSNYKCKCKCRCRSVSKYRSVYRKRIFNVQQSCRLRELEGVVSTKLPEEYGVVMNSSLEL